MESADGSVLHLVAAPQDSRFLDLSGYCWVPYGVFIWGGGVGGRGGGVASSGNLLCRLVQPSVVGVAAALFSFFVFSAALRSSPFPAKRWIESEKNKELPQTEADGAEPSRRDSAPVSQNTSQAPDGQKVGNDAREVAGSKKSGAAPLAHEG